MAFKPTYSILLHYSEIALKLKNRSYFEKIFISNINKHIQGLNYSKIELNAARVFIHKININDWHKFKSRIKNIMGLQHATLVIETKTNLDDIKNSTEILIKNKDFKSFRITTKRNDVSTNNNEKGIKRFRTCQEIAMK